MPKPKPRPSPIPPPSDNGHKRAAIYARVSTEEQADYGASLTTQLESCHRYAEQCGLHVAVEHDEDVSGAVPIGQRKKGAQIATAVATRQIDAVVVHHIDRLSRNLIDALVTVRDWMAAGIEVHATDIGRITSSDDIRLVIGAWQSADERKRIAERTQRGMRNKAARTWTGQSAPPYGYRKVGQGREAKLEFDDAEIAIVRRIHREYLQERKSAKRIAAGLTADGIPTSQRRMKRGKNGSRGWWVNTVLRVLTNRVYVGEFGYSDSVARIPELAVIDAQTFAAIQERIGRNKVFARRNRKRDYLLAGYLLCACGRAMIAHAAAHGRSPYYYCSTKLNRHLAICDEPAAGAIGAERAVWAWVVGVLDADRIRAGVAEYTRRQAEGLSNHAQRLAELDERIAQQTQQLDMLVRDLADLRGASGRDALKQQINAVSDTLDGLRARRAETDAEPRPALPDAERIAETAATIHAYLERGTVSCATRRLILDELRVSVRVEYREGVRGLRVRSERFYVDDWLPLPVTRGKRCVR